MAQQINLNDPRFAPQAQRFSAQQGLVAVLVVLGVAVAGAQGLGFATRRLQAQAQAVEAANGPLRQKLVADARPAANPGAVDSRDADAELNRLRQLEASQRRIRAALDAGIAGARDGHAEYLVALARQAASNLWITGFTVAEGGATLELEGRMTDASALTDYLRKLNAEPRFKGRAFSQLSLQVKGGADGQPTFTEFTLRANAAQQSPP